MKSGVSRTGLLFLWGLALSVSAWADVQSAEQPHSDATEVPAKKESGSRKHRRKRPETEAEKIVSPYHIGFQAGVSFSGYSLTPADPNASVRTGFILGGQGEIPLGGVFFFQPELRLEQRGFQTSYPQPTGGAINASLNLLSLELPLLFKVKWGSGTAWMPYFVAGPSLQYRLSGSFTGTDPNGVELTMISPSFASLDLSALSLAVDVGGGAEFELTRKLWFYGLLRYSQGLFNETGAVGSTARYHGFQLTTGLNFSI